ncbi:MAG TPA: Hsp20/alpha crystallin family protein [Bacteroidales bacterium]|nr:Hsp20/alpha crystallin family protein [Bacteroidales bacterium]
MEDLAMLALRNLNSLPSFVEEFFNHELPYSWNRNWATISTPAVNIVESKDEFRIEVAAPGLTKEDFKINLENDQLTISANKEVKKEENEETYTRREFSYSSFSRSFTLPETVDSEKIKASHQDGVLTIHVPKKEEAKPKPAREIAVA